MGPAAAVLDGDDPDYPPSGLRLFRVYAEAVAGNSTGADEELANKAEDEQASVLATLTSVQWKAIRRFRQEAHILTVAEANPAMLDVAIHWLVVRAAGLVAPDGAPGGGVSRNKGCQERPPAPVKPRPS